MKNSEDRRHTRGIHLIGGAGIVIPGFVPTAGPEAYVRRRIFLPPQRTTPDLRLR